MLASAFLSPDRRILEPIGWPTGLFFDPVQLTGPTSTLALKVGLYFLRCFGISQCFLTATAAFSLGSELSLNHLSSFPGPPQCWGTGWAKAYMSVGSKASVSPRRGASSGMMP